MARLSRACDRLAQRVTDPHRGHRRVAACLEPKNESTARTAGELVTMALQACLEGERRAGVAYDAAGLREQGYREGTSVGENSCAFPESNSGRYCCSGQFVKIYRFNSCKRDARRNL